jgi:hypothetical protein
MFFRTLKNNTHKNKKLQNSFNKHGIISFSWTVLKIVDDDNLIHVEEQLYIDALKPYYNICLTTGKAFNLGRVFTEEHRKNIGKAKKGVKHGTCKFPPNGWGAVEKIIWENHQNLLEIGHEAKILYANEINIGDFDVVHVHVANLANILAERGIPYIFTFHDHHAFLYGKDSGVFKENMKAIESSLVTLVPAKFLVDYFEGIPEYFSHGVNTNYFTPKGK